MLKISAIEAVGEPNILRLDGQVSGRWVKLLQKVCEARMRRGAQVAIDMQNVSFADRDGVALLHGLNVRGVKILNALPFIAEQIAKALPE